MQFDDPKMQAGYEAYVTQARQREAAYFQKIGVQQQSTVYGQRDEFKAHADCVGWDYSPAAMAALGMRRIELADGVWQPDRTFEGKCLFRVEAVRPAP